MITITLKCRHCGGENLVRDGFAPNGKQRYWCHDCHRSSRENPTHSGYSAAEREVILRAYEERSSLRGLERTFDVARQTVSSWLKKKTPRSPL
jgi:transposase-like protein